MDFKPGDFVKLSGQETIAEVLSVKGNDLEVAAGLLKIIVKKNKVEKVSAPKEERSHFPENHLKSTGIDTRDKLLRFKFELDVRGIHKEEILNEITTWIDDALILGVEEATIVHGKGNVTRDAVRSILRKYKEVKSATDAPSDRGGDYMTVVKFAQ